MLDKDGLNWEISVGVTFSSLMGAVSLFFTGVLISQYHSFDASIKVPLLFLIISTFSFIFSATIYSNAGTEVTLGKLKTVEKYMIYAKNIVEFLGLYPLILSMPLVIGAVTQDNFLRVTTTLVALVGLALYSQSKFSVLEKQLPSQEKLLYSIVFIVSSLCLYLSQYVTKPLGIFTYSNIGIAVLVLLLGPAVYFSTRSRQYKVISVRPFRAGDLPHLSRIMAATMKRLKSKNPSLSLTTEAIAEASSEASITKLAKDSHLYVALFGGKAAGVVGLRDNVLTTIFTDPSLQRKGVGRALVDYVEAEALRQGHQAIDVHTELDHKFYERLGFIFIEKDEHGSHLRREI
jgi:hypothetical protein